MSQPPQLKLGKAATITGTAVVFNGAINSSSTPSVNTDLTNKLYVDNTVLVQSDRIDTILSGAALDMDTLVELTNFFTALSGEGTDALTNLTNTVIAETTRATAAETGLLTSLNSEISRATAAEVACNAYTDAEVETELARALAAEAALSTALGSEISSRISSESGLASDLAGEVARAEAAEAGLASDLASEASTARAAEAAELARAQAAEAGLASDLAAEVTAARAAEAAELARAQAAEAGLTSDLATEASTARAAEAAELARAQAAEAGLASDLATEASTARAAEAAELARAQAAEAGLASDLATEASTARAAEAAELARAQAAESSLASDLASEASTARAAEAAELARAQTAEARLVTLLNYTKPLSQEAAIHNSVGAVVGDLPTSMPEAIFTAGYDGWYFTNTNVSPAFNFVNWKFNSNFPNVAFSDVNSVSVNMQVLSVASVPVLTVFTKPTGLDVNYHQKITYSLSSTALAALTVNNLYTFYAISAPPQIPNHAQVQLSVVSINGPALAGGEMVLDFNLLSDVAQSSGNVSFIASQLSIGSTNGNENWILSNDSIRANQTRARLDAIYYYFFTTDSSVDPDPEDIYPSN